MSYLPQQATADRLIAKFGAACTLSTNPSAEYDGLGNPIAVAPYSIDGVGVKLNYKSGEIDGSTVLMGDAKLYLSTRGKPLIDMRVTLAGETWRVVAVATLAPDSTDVVLYTLQLRK